MFKTKVKAAVRYAKTVLRWRIKYGRTWSYILSSLKDPNCTWVATINDKFCWRGTFWEFCLINAM